MRPWLMDLDECQMMRPVRASSAKASLAEVTNISPFITTGVASIESDMEEWKTQAARRLPAFSMSIWSRLV